MEPLGTSLPHVRNVAVELSNGVRTPATSSCSNQGSVVKRDNGQVIDHQETGITIFQSALSLNVGRGNYSRRPEFDKRFKHSVIEDHSGSSNEVGQQILSNI